VRSKRANKSTSEGLLHSAHLKAVTIDEQGAWTKKKEPREEKRSSGRSLGRLCDVRGLKRPS